MKLHPRRRWFSFSLRTLFVVVTLLACGLGYFVHERTMFEQRRQLLDWFAARGGDKRPEAPTDPYSRPYPGHGIEPYRVPYFRRLLGDEEHLSFWLPEGTDEQMRARFFQAFPEAYVAPLGSVHSDPKRNR